MSKDTGFNPVGTVSMTDLYQSFNYRNWTYYWTPAVRRSVMADDFVYAISDAGIRVATLADPAAALATVTFDPPQVKAWEDSRTGANSPWSPTWRARRAQWWWVAGTSGASRPSANARPHRR